MTNEQIIMDARVELAKQGLIGLTGRVFTMQTEDGEEIQFPEPEEIHTFQHWKELGYNVKKGEHCIARIQIWKMGKGKEESEPEEEGTIKKVKMFKKIAFFFAPSQVERMVEG